MWTLVANRAMTRPALRLCKLIASQPKAKRGDSPVSVAAETNDQSKGNHKLTFATGGSSSLGSLLLQETMNPSRLSPRVTIS